MAQDLVLEAQTGGLYKLAGPSADLAERLKSRVIAQELSTLHNGRGSAFISMMKAGRIKTSSSIVGMFTAATAGILQNMRSASYEVSPISIRLDGFSQVDATTLLLRVAITGNIGTVTETLTVSTS